MKRFLALYMGSMTAEKMQNWNSMSDENKKKRSKEGMTAWMNWGEKNSASIVDNGGPLGKTKLADPKGISDTKNLLTGYVIIEAESHEAAAKLFVNHPHFSIFPGESVEIVECLPMPKM